MTRSEKAHLRRLKSLERTSSADLEALLLLDFQSQKSGGAEMDEVLRAAEILAEREPRRDSGADRAWAVFVEKYRPFASGSSLYEDAEALGASAVAVQPRPAPSPSLRRRMRRLARRISHPISYQIVRTAACLVLCLLLTGGLLLAFSPESRSVFSGWVREICGDHFEYHYASSNMSAGTEADQAVIYRPTWLPEGYRLTGADEPGGSTSVFYTNGSEYGLLFQYFPASDNGFSIYAEGPPETVTVHGKPADLYPAPQEGMVNLLIWGDTEAELLMSLLSDLPPGDLLQIAESVQASAAKPPPNRPLWFPEDYTLQTSGSGINDLGIYYASEDGERLCYAYAAAGSNSWERSRSKIREATADLKAEEVLINGLPAQLYRQADGTGHLVWTNTFHDLYWISGPLPAEELIKMAESVIMGP